MSQKSPNKSALTPQRKHRKLLKDGSGSEVWPEAVEAIFVQGLREYWDSPWATYSRGRSKWRNQYLMDYLEKAGIVRTKKQVASHIQVLKSMWKTEPEFLHLVAGGDDCLDDTPPPVKWEDKANDTGFERASSCGSSQPDPISPAPKIKTEISSPDQKLSSLPYFSTESYSPTTHLAFPNNNLTDSPASPASLDLSLSGASSSPASSTHSATLPFITVPQPLVQPRHVDQWSDMKAPTFQHSRQKSARVTSICLLADEMPPLAYTFPDVSPNRAPPLLRTKLSIASIDDDRGPSTVHGFMANVSLSAVWTSFAKCITRVYVAGACISQESGPLEAMTIQFGTVVAMLPDSTLTRCRWLDASQPTILTQEIIVDNESLLHVVYELDRRTIFHSAEALSCHIYRPGDRVVSPQALSSFQHPQNKPGPYRTSLSYALAPMTVMRSK
ncbi:hypothetical protein C8J56DRAFT_864950 [Mycena floridula]|nr:hypothetical protein C8J56DRAFT_864950 [Mycena floridula]